MVRDANSRLERDGAESERVSVFSLLKRLGRRRLDGRGMPCVPECGTGSRAGGSDCEKAAFGCGVKSVWATRRREARDRAERMGGERVGRRLERGDRLVRGVNGARRGEKMVVAIRGRGCLVCRRRGRPPR